MKAKRIETINQSLTKGFTMITKERLQKMAKMVGATITFHAPNGINVSHPNGDFSMSPVDWDFTRNASHAFRFLVNLEWTLFRKAILKLTGEERIALRNVAEKSLLEDDPEEIGSSDIACEQFHVYQMTRNGDGDFDTKKLMDWAGDYVEA